MNSVGSRRKSSDTVLLGRIRKVCMKEVIGNGSFWLEFEDLCLRSHWSDVKYLYTKHLFGVRKSVREIYIKRRIFCGYGENRKR